MRPALQESIIKVKLGTVELEHVPASVLGLNTRDAVADMNMLYATLLDNFYPRPSEVQIRGGSLDFATGATGIVKNFAQYLSQSGTSTLFAVTDAGIYNATAGGAVGAVVQVLTNGDWLSTIATNSAGSAYLWGANGVDTPKMFEGTTWSTPAVTGVAEGNTNINSPLVFKHRIFFLINNSMNMYYLPIDSIQGAATAFSFGNLFRLGGSLKSATSWTLDSGSGPDDLLAIITSEGELAVYKGTDPSSAATWNIVGVWTVGKPLGNKCFFKLGGDVGVLTEAGVFSLSTILQSGEINADRALSNKIQPSWTSITGLSSTPPSWSACVYPAFDALLINTPATATTPAIQFVMNTITNAWCTFSGLPSVPACLTVFKNQLYYGTSTKVVKFWDPQRLLWSDNGVDIVATVHTASNYFKRKGKLKKVQLLRFLLNILGSADVRWGISPDFTNIQMRSFIPRLVTAGNTPWDTSDWDVSPWSQDLSRQKQWKGTAHAPGFALSLWLQIVGNNGTVSWAGTDYQIDSGGTL